MRHRLRLFTGDESVATEHEPTFTVRLGDVSHALIDAARRKRAWLSDFEDDEVQVSADLYEVITAYLRYRPGA